jgi:hypothetical protein
MNKDMGRLLLASVFVLLFCSLSYAQYEETDEGYDENTEIRVKGYVTDVWQRMRGAVIVIVRSGRRDYRVVTGPQRYLAQEGVEFNPGDTLMVTGSKVIARDGSLLIIARYIKNTGTGRTLLLRDSSLIPLWRGGHHHMGRRNNKGHHMNRDGD